MAVTTRICCTSLGYNQESFTTKTWATRMHHCISSDCNCSLHGIFLRLARIPVAPDGTPLISAEEVVIQEEGDEYSGFVTSSAQSKTFPSDVQW